jgi:4-hydroxy-2-oxoheptanedioate aldolase
MWAKSQPVYYTGVGDTPEASSYEAGKRMAATKADYINYGMESGPLDFKGLSDFMRGLADAGPTRSGHRTPAVIVELPIPGTVEEMRANAWMVQQALAQGVHGIMLTNAENPEAVRLMIEASRYPFAPKAVGLSQGWRGNGSQNFASKIWGVTPQEYMRIAEPWPLNPDGELIFGVKIENPRADANLEGVLAVPGLSFVEHGPGDNSFYFVGRPGSYQGSAADTPQMKAIEAAVFAAAKKNHLMFLHGCSETTVEEMIKEGVMICTGGETPAADKGRAYSKRTDPW